MSFEKALQAIESLRNAIKSEVERARNERILLRSLDADALLLRVSQRAEFNTRIERFQQEIANALRDVAAVYGLAEVTVEQLKAIQSIQGNAFSEMLCEVRALAAALAELDELNQLLAQRALSYIHGYLYSVTPAVSAYTRKGTLSNTTDLGTTSRRA